MFLHSYYNKIQRCFPKDEMDARNSPRQFMVRYTSDDGQWNINIERLALVGIPKTVRAQPRLSI